MGRHTACIWVFALLLFGCGAYSWGSDPSTPTLEARVAQLEARINSAPAINSGDNAWVLVSAALVLMMTAPGLILFYGGLEAEALEGVCRRIEPGAVGDGHSA